MAEDVKQEGDKKMVSIAVVIVILLIIGGAFLSGRSGPKEMIEEPEVVATTTPEVVEFPVAAERAAKVLAGGLGAPVETIKIVSASEKEWSDGCLGLAKEGELCTQALVPGFEIKLEAQGVTYTYRADKPGNQIRADRGATK